MTTNMVERSKLPAFIVGLAAAAIMASASLVSAGVNDPNYQEGFGKNATGGAGQPTCTVTSSAATGAGTFDACFTVNIGGNVGVQNRIIQFAVTSFTTNQRHTIGSNVTIDGCANGQNGVLYDQTISGAYTKNALLIQDPADNIIIKCINFISTGAPSSEVIGSPNYNPNIVAEDNFIWIVPVSGGTISNILIDRCTFFQATNKAFDITGAGNSGTVRNVTLQRSLFHDNAYTALYKYADGSTLIKYAISVHHNVYARGGERHIGQVKDRIGDPNLGPFDIVNNISYLAPGYYMPNSPDGGSISPYALRFWNSNATAQATGVGRAGGPDTESWFGSITANVVANAFLGAYSIVEIRTDAGASESNNYISADNYWSDASADPNHNHYQGSTTPSAPGTISLPWNSPNPIPTAYQVTTLAVTQLKSQLLPYVGAPNRTALDTQRLNEVAAQLPGSGPPPPPSGLQVR